MTDTTTPSMREEFEKWYETDLFVTPDFSKSGKNNEYYQNSSVEECWETWQAATANMQNKLDESKEEEDVSYQALMSVSKLLAQIAITLKGEELPLHLYSYHDLPELVEKMKLAKSELEAKIAELQKDADRYRWLIENCTGSYPDMSGNHKYWLNANRHNLRGQSITAAIDSAIAEEGVK